MSIAGDACVVDTNVLLYRHDSSEPARQRKAIDALRKARAGGSVVVPWQVLVEFVGAATKRRGRYRALLSLDEAAREAHRLCDDFDVLLPDEETLLIALAGAARFKFSWFDALIWAAAEQEGIPTLYSEDFTHDATYGGVRIVNPFA